MNTDGSYFCSCMDGFELVKGTNQCIGNKHALYCVFSVLIYSRFGVHADVNECVGINDCQQICVNIDGSFTCTCTKGFALAPDGKNCTGMMVMQSKKICSYHTHIHAAKSI